MSARRYASVVILGLAAGPVLFWGSRVFGGLGIPLLLRPAVLNLVFGFSLKWWSGVVALVYGAIVATSITFFCAGDLTAVGPACIWIAVFCLTLALWVPVNAIRRFVKPLPKEADD